MAWEFLADGRFLVMAIVLLCLGVVIGLAFSGNLPEVIDLTESQKNTVVLREERACASQLREIQRDFVDQISVFDDAFHRCFERNSELIDGLDDLEDSVVGKIEDLNSSLVDLNALIADWNCG